MNTNFVQSKNLSAVAIALRGGFRVECKHMVLTIPFSKYRDNRKRGKRKPWIDQAKEGVNTLSKRNCPIPKVRRFINLPFSHHAGTPGRLNFKIFST